MLSKILSLIARKPPVEPKPTEPARSGRWPAVRAEHLRREPACAACGCSDKSVLQVHHIYPFSWPHGEQSELDDGRDGTGRDGNLITLCEQPGRNCHFVIGHLLDWRSRNPNVRRDAAVMLARIKARPYPEAAA